MPLTLSQLERHLFAAADILRADYKQSGYGKVILPFTVLRRLAPMKAAAAAGGACAHPASVLRLRRRRRDLGHPDD